MAEGGGEIGRAYVRVDADLEPLEAKLNQVPGKVNAATGGAGGVPGQGGGGGFKITPSDADTEKAVGNWQKQIGAVTQFLAKMSAVAGVAALFYKIGEAIRNGFQDPIEQATKASEEFAQTLNYSDASNSLDNVNKELEELSSLLGGLQESDVITQTIQGLQGVTESGLEARIKNLSELQGFLQQSADQQKATKEAQEDQRQLDNKRNLSTKIQEIRGRSQSAEKQADDALARDQIAAIAARGKAKTDTEKALYLELYKAIGQERERIEKELQQKMTDAGEAAAMDAIEREARAREEMAKRVADVTQQAMSRAFSITDSSLERIEVGINRLVEIIQMRDGGGL